jgi:uncharacterized integral membrane protein
MPPGPPGYFDDMTGPSYARPDDDLPGSTPLPGDPTLGPAGEPYGSAAGEPSGTAYEQEPATRTAPATPTAPERVPVRTRISGLWVASISAVVVLLLLLIFILQNGSTVKINLFGANPSLPIGVALLLAAVLGALLVALVGAARVVQLRHTARRMAKTNSR